MKVEHQSIPVELAQLLAGRVGVPLRSGPGGDRDDAAVSVVDWPRSGADELLELAERSPITIVVGEEGSAEDRSGVDALGSALQLVGATAEHLGRSRYSRVDVGPATTPLAIFRGVSPPVIGPAPDDFRVSAVICAFNEEDVIESTLAHLVSEGVDVVLIDNHSTDRTVERAESFLGRGLLEVQRFPEAGPTGTYDWQSLLHRVEVVAASLDADWIIRNDADEIRTSPWRGVSLRDALHHVHQLGYSAVNHTLLNFQLTQDTFTEGAPLPPHFPWFEPALVGDRTQLNAWRRPECTVDLAWSGGHTVRFPGRRIFPYNFLLRHYPIRSVEQGTRKVLQDRVPRYNAEERAMGWHTHYDHIDGAGDILRSPEGMLRYDDDFDGDHLVERLSGIGFGLRLKPRGARHAVAAALQRANVLDHVLRLKRLVARR